MNVLSKGCDRRLKIPTQLPKPMDAPILIVGSDEFKSTLLERLSWLASPRLEIASNPKEALPLIQAEQPNVIILQASQVGSLDLCRQIKQLLSLIHI